MSTSEHDSEDDEQTLGTFQQPIIIDDTADSPESSPSTDGPNSLPWRCFVKVEKHSAGDLARTIDKSPVKVVPGNQFRYARHKLYIVTSVGQVTL